MRDGCGSTVLFVDDEPNIINSLKRWAMMLNEPWQVLFAPGGREALALMDSHTVDVLVTDMRMPEMNGAELLGEVLLRHPATIRMVLTGHSEKEMIFRVVTTAHQFLTKPHDPWHLREVIRRALKLRRLLGTPDIRRIVSGMEKLTVQPRCYLHFVEKLRAVDPLPTDVTGMILADVSLCGKILQLVNSSFFGGRPHLTDMGKAVEYLGVDTLRSLMLHVEMFDADATDDQSFAVLSHHSLRVARLSRDIMLGESLDQKLADEAFAAGILHDIGQVVCRQSVPEYALVDAIVSGQGLSRVAAEEEVIGTNHQSIGAYLLGLWGLPDNVVEAVAWHHRPGTLGGRDFLPVTAVHIADVLSRDATDAQRSQDVEVMDSAYLAELGVMDRLPFWKEMAASRKSATTLPNSVV